MSIDSIIDSGTHTRNLISKRARVTNRSRSGIKIFANVLVPGVVAIGVNGGKFASDRRQFVTIAVQADLEGSRVVLRSIL